MAKTKEIKYYHPEPKIEWKIFIGRRKLCPVPYSYSIPDLKMFKKVK